MFAKLPGPLDVLDPASLRPFPTRSSFEGLVSNEIGNLSGVDPLLGTAALHIAAPFAGDIDQAYGSSMGAVAGDFDYDVTYAASSPAGAIVGSGDSADNIRQSVLQHLPQPDAPIEASFSDPPMPPGGQLTEPGPAFLAPGEPAPPVFTKDDVEEAIAQMYRTELGREPDPDGLAHWKYQVVNYGHSIAWVHDQIVGSDEYRQHHGG